MPSISMGVVLFGIAARSARRYREENPTYTILVTLPDGLDITLTTTVPKEVTQQRIESGLKQGVIIRLPEPTTEPASWVCVIIVALYVFIPIASFVVLGTLFLNMLYHFGIK